MTSSCMQAEVVSSELRPVLQAPLATPIGERPRGALSLSLARTLLQMLHKPSTNLP